MKKIFVIIVINFFLWSSISFAGKTGSGGLLGLGGLLVGDWKPAISMGDNIWMVEGRPLSAAMEGAKEHCSDLGKKFQFMQAITADVKYPNIIFMCN